MKRCLIHIGMHKTGTTSIQRTLSSVPHPADWHYVKLGPYINLGVPFFAMFSPNPTSYHWFSKKNQTHDDAVAMGKKWKVELKQMIESSSAKQFIFSGEGIGLLCQEGLENMRTFLAPLFDEIRIVGYVRAPIGFRTSMFQQRIKNGRRSFDAVTTPLVYRSRFEMFDKLFGRDKVDLWKFDPKTFANGCVVTDFCCRVNIQFDPGASVVRTNESLTREGLGILYAYRKLGDGYGTGATVVKENRAIFNALLEMKGGKFKFAPSVFRELTPEDAQEIAWMEVRLGASLVGTIDPAQGGIASEEELLTISRDSCLSFVAEFEKLHGVTVPSKHIPETNPAEPRAVADLVAQCRAIYCRECMGKPRPAVDNNQSALSAEQPINTTSKKTKPGGTKLTLVDLIDLAVTRNEPALATMSRKRGRALLKGVFAAISESLESLGPGEVIQVRGLGRFSVSAPESPGATVGRSSSGSILFVPDSATHVQAKARAKSLSRAANKAGEG